MDDSPRSPWARPTPSEAQWTYPPDPPFTAADSAADATRVLPRAADPSPVDATQVLPTTPVPEPTLSFPVPEPTLSFPVQPPDREPTPPQPQQSWPEAPQPQPWPSAPVQQAPWPPGQGQPQASWPQAQPPYPAWQQPGFPSPAPAWQGYLTGPPPQKSGAKTFFGWALIVWASLMTLSFLSGLAQGTMTLVGPDLPETIGHLIGLFIMIVLPMWLGIHLKNSHAKAMFAWRQREMAAIDWDTQQRAMARGGLPVQQAFVQPQYPGQPYPPQYPHQG